MIMMGGDFNYENAITYYKNIDKLLYYLNKVCVCLCVCEYMRVCMCAWLQNILTIGSNNVVGLFPTEWFNKYILFHPNSLSWRLTQC